MWNRIQSIIFADSIGPPTSTVIVVLDDSSPSLARTSSDSFSLVNAGRNRRSCSRFECQPLALPSHPELPSAVPRYGRLVRRSSFSGQDVAHDVPQPTSLGNQVVGAPLSAVGGLVLAEAVVGRCNPDICNKKKLMSPIPTIAMLLAGGMSRKATLLPTSISQNPVLCSVYGADTADRKVSVIFTPNGVWSWSYSSVTQDI